MSSFYEAMHDVLERSEYDILTGRAIDYQQIIMEALGRAIISLLEGIQLSTPESPVYNLEAIIYIFIITAVLLLLGALTGVIYIILKRRGQKVTNEASISAIFDDIANKRFTLSDLLRLTREYAEKNQLRDAIRYHYIAVLVVLDDKRIIRVDKSKTNAQLTQELTLAAPALSDSFISVVDVFQQSWFGKRQVDEAKYRDFTAEAEEIFRENEK